MRKLILSVALATSPAYFAYGQAGPSSSPAKDETRQAAKVQVLAASQMSKADADVLAAHRDAIASAAEVNGYDLGSGSWIKNQVICPDAPRHLLMHYLKISPDGSVSLFTAAVPRSSGDSNLRVRIVPVLYHGAQAFHVFGSSPSQRELINEVVPLKPHSSPEKDNLDWTTLAYCYAALAGAEPTVKSVTAPEEATPLLSVTGDGGLREMRFSVVGPEHVVQDWKIVFDRQAKVYGIFLSAKSANVQQVPPEPPSTKWKPIKEGQTPSERPIPPAGPSTEKPVQQPQ